MPSAGVIPPDTDLYRALEASAGQRCLVFAGLPGTGKSLLTQQCAAIANAAGRDVTLLQWDVAREAFATDRIKARYPEVDGITHANIRMAVDHWARTGVARWHRESGADALLIVEAPLIGGRLSSLARSQSDATEALLGSDESLFLLPVPSSAVKAALRGKRHDSKTVGTGREQLDAAVNVLDAHVAEIATAGVALGLTDAVTAEYDPELYAAVYLHALRHRQSRRLDIDRLYDVSASVYERAARVAELAPLPDEIDSAFDDAESLAEPVRDRSQAHWYR